MLDEPKGRIRSALTDEILRRLHFEEGKKPGEIAREYGCSAPNISQRIKKLKEKTVAAVVAPEESKRYAGRQIDAMGELTRSLARVNKLYDACEEWLLDPETGKYDIGPRSDEVIVFYEVIDENGRPKQKKATLAYLLTLVDGMDAAGLVTRTESKHADPRELVLKTAQEVRQTVNTLVELGQLMASLQSMERYREHFLAALEKVDPDFAQRLVEAVRRDLLLNPAFAGSGAALSSTA
ncbi:MAG: helix-turn-helix domain-containing protein [Armatimonadetes bacterium]|nr:helix-turn-helix domain-containing protein [Armatimonadota bacterium]